MSTDFHLWDNYKRGVMPHRGGWLDQPLSILVRLMVIGLVFNTYHYKNTPDADWSKFTPLQRDLIRWLEND